MAKLKAVILAVQTLGELHALIEDYSYEEFMQIYNQLTPAQQAKLNAIDERDKQVQMLAIDQAPLGRGVGCGVWGVGHQDLPQQPQFGLRRESSAKAHSSRAQAST